MTAYVDDMGDEERKALQGGGQPNPAPHPGQRIARLESALLEAVIALEIAGRVDGVSPEVYQLANRLREAIDGTVDGNDTHITQELVDLAKPDPDLIAAQEQADVYRDRCQQLTAEIAELQAECDAELAAEISVLAEQRQRLAAESIDLERRLDTAYVMAIASVDQQADLTAAVRTLAARIRRIGGYSTPEDQDELRAAERLVAGTTS